MGNSSSIIVQNETSEVANTATSMTIATPYNGESLPVAEVSVVQEAVVVPKDLGTFAYLLAQQDRFHNMNKLMTNKIKNKIKQPLIELLNKEYNILTNKEFNEEQIKLLEDKILNYYTKYNLIKFNDQDYYYLAKDLVSCYFTYIVSNERIPYAVEGEWYPFEESRKNPQFCKFQDYYMNKEERINIEEKITIILQPYANSYREVIEIFDRNEKLMNETFEKLDHERLETFVQKI